MGMCFECSSKGMIEKDMEVFFEHMLIRFKSHSETEKEIKTLLKINGERIITEKSWELLVSKYLSRNKDQTENDNYKSFWLEIYRNSTNLDLLIVSLLLLSEKNKIKFKQKFEDLCKLFKKNPLYELVKEHEDLQSYLIKKELVSSILNHHYILVSQSCLMYAPIIKDDTSDAKKYLEAVYSKENINAFTESALLKLDKFIEDKPKKGDMVVRKDNYYDIDDFLEFAYYSLIDDKKIRDELDTFASQNKDKQK